MHLPVQKLDYRHGKTGRAEGTEEEVKNAEWSLKSFGRLYSLWLVQMLRILGLRDSSVRWRQIKRCLWLIKKKSTRATYLHDTAHPISIKTATRWWCRATVTLLSSLYSGRYLLHRTDEVAAAVFLPASWVHGERALLHPQSCSPGLPAADQTLFSQQGRNQPSSQLNENGASL